MPGGKESHDPIRGQKRPQIYFYGQAYRPHTSWILKRRVYFFVWTKNIMNISKTMTLQELPVCDLPLR